MDALEPDDDAPRSPASDGRKVYDESSRAREAENKRVTGGSAAGHFWDPHQGRRDTRRPSAAHFSPDGFSVLRSDTRLTLLRSLGYW